MYYFEKFTGYRSSGINFLYWMCMIGYGIIKIRSLSLIAVDNNGVRLHICYTLTCTHAHTLTWSRRFQYLHKHKMCTYYDMRVLILYVFMCVCVTGSGGQVPHGHICGHFCLHSSPVSPVICTRPKVTEGPIPARTRARGTYVC